VGAGSKVRYDAAIIGAGADGLAAAILLARANLEVVVIERATEPGGRCAAIAFAPGFRATPFIDDVPAIPAALAQSLALAEHGVRLEEVPADARILFRRDAILARARREAQSLAPHGMWGKLQAHMAQQAGETPVWPGIDWADKAIADLGIAADMVHAGRALDPELSGSALALLTAPRSRVAGASLDALAKGLAAAARAAGAEIRYQAEASEIRLHRRKAQTLVLADGSQIETGTILSTLDFKRTFLSLFPWTALPAPLLAAARDWRMQGARARLLLALRAPTILETPVFQSGDDEALAAFRRGAVPDRPPLLADPVSRRDATLAPPGGSVITVTLGAIPHTLFDGPWSGAKRAMLAARALARLEGLAPGTVASLAGLRIIVPPDIEEALGASGGDLDGGQIAPDQMLGFRPGPRTAIDGVYLAGPSAQAAPHGACVAGAVAATAILADRSGDGS
jgi:phytoene dehydrogenase-like protein